MQEGEQIARAPPLQPAPRSSSEAYAQPVPRRPGVGVMPPSQVIPALHDHSESPSHSFTHVRSESYDAPPPIGTPQDLDSQRSVEGGSDGDDEDDRDVGGDGSSPASARGPHSTPPTTAGAHDGPMTPKGSMDAHFRSMTRDSPPRPSAPAPGAVDGNVFRRPSDRYQATDTSPHIGYGGPDHPRSGQVAPPPSTRSDIANWAPSKQVPMPSGMLQLPDLHGRAGGAGDVLTSFNIGTVSPLQREMEMSIGGLLSEKVFEELMTDSLGRHRFREYLTNVQGDVSSLDIWTDLRAFKQMTESVKSTAVALHEVFYEASSKSNTLSSELREDVFHSLRQSMTMGDSLDLPQQALLSSLYRNEFMSFIKHKLVEQASVRLGQLGLTDEDKMRGLADCFCLTNPRLRDHPIVLVSAGFERLTGYHARFIVGRNCRMLAGPATNPLTSKRIATALHQGQGINTLILNYRADGTPFWNLLSIIPLRGHSGEITYFIGGQTEVTGTLSAGSHLSFLVGSDADPSRPIDIKEDFSPRMQAYSAALAVSGTPEAPVFGSTGGGGPPGQFGGLSGGPDPRSVGFSAFTPRTAGRQDLGRSSGSIQRDVDFPAGGQAKKGRQNEFRGIGSVEKKGLKGLWAAMKGEGGNSNGRAVKGLVKGEDQQFAGAEVLYNREAKPVEVQIASFASVYSKLIVFRRSNREILFVTADFLAFVGLPAATQAEICRSPLIHTDLLDLIVASKENDKKAHRRRVKDAIQRGVPNSIACEVKMQSVRRALYDPVTKSSTLHLTPLHDRDGTVEAYTAIFG